MNNSHWLLHLFLSVSAVSESRLSSKIARNETNLSHQRQQCFFLIFFFAPFPFACFSSAPSNSFFFSSRFCFVSDAARGRENSWLARNDYETFMAERTLHTKPKKGPKDGERSNLQYLECAHSAHHPHSIIRTSLAKVRKRLLEGPFPLPFPFSFPFPHPIQME